MPREVLLHGSWDDRTVRLVPDGEPANASNPERAPRRPVAASDEETIFITIIDLPPGTFTSFIYPCHCRRVAFSVMILHLNPAL